MEILVIIPTQKEFDFFLQGCQECGFQAEYSMLGRLPAVRFPDLDVTLSCGGLGKVQFAVQTRHLVDACPDQSLVICAGAAGALVDNVSVGDIVVATETVEHDINNRFGPPLLPRFTSAENLIAEFRSMSWGSNSFRVHFGPIASGDEDVVDTERRRTLYELTGGLVVAWEGAGGARACQFSDTPFDEIRGVTDSADSDAPSDFEANRESVMQNLATLITHWAKERRI